MLSHTNLSEKIDVPLLGSLFAAFHKVLVLANRHGAQLLREPKGPLGDFFLGTISLMPYLTKSSSF